MNYKSLGALILVLVLFVVAPVQQAWAATVSVSGKAKSLTTSYYLDFANYNSNVTIDTATGNMSGYAFSEDVGWVAFGTTDNAQGPVNINLSTGAVTGKAKILATDYFIDFTNYNSNVSVNTATGAFSGYAFAEDLGWINFGDTGVTSAALVSPSPTPSPSPSTDTTPPAEFTLDRPAHNDYINSERPTFRWKAASDANGIASYTLDVDNGSTGDFTVNGIPASGTQEYTTTKFIARFEGFNDSVADNEYISVYTRSTSEWAQEQNDGKLKEGKRTWRVMALDPSGNARVMSREVLVDFTGPSTTVSSVNSVTSTTTAYSTSDTTPTITGRVSDPLAGTSESQSIASGPSSVEVMIERSLGGGSYTLHSLGSLQIPARFWDNNGQVITENLEQLSAKYATYAFTPSVPLPLGLYKVTVTGKDFAGNATNHQVIFVTVRAAGTVSRQVSTTSPVPTSPIPASPISTPRASSSPAPQLSPSPTATTQPSPTPSDEPETIETPLPTETANEPDKPSFLASVGNAVKAPFVWLGRTGGNIWTYLKYSAQAGYEYLADRHKTGTAFASRFSQWISYVSGSFGEIMFDQEPTRITDVKVAEVGKDYAVVTWRTTHFTKNNKLNYGTDRSYGNHVFAADFAKEHTVKLENLQPGETYVFEVMSQNRNYVYDSFHEFTTKSE